MIAIVRAIRRIDTGSIEIGVVHGSCGSAARRPIVAVDAISSWNLEGGPHDLLAGITLDE